MSRAVSACLGMALIASTSLASCGPDPSTNWTTRLTRSDGVTLTVTVEDAPAVVDAIAIGMPDPRFRPETTRGLGLLNPDGDPTRLLVTWTGGVCARTDVSLGVARSGTGLSISVREPRSLQSCKDAVAEMKAIELRLRTPVDAHLVTGTLLDP